MEETTFFESDEVTVTSSRIIFPHTPPTDWQRIFGGAVCSSTTYAVQGITSVKQDTKSPSRILAYLFMLIGVLSIMDGVGVFIILVCFLWLYNMKDMHTISFNSSSGETKVFSSDDKEFVDGVVRSINNAIVHNRE